MIKMFARTLVVIALGTGTVAAQNNPWATPTPQPAPKTPAPAPQPKQPPTPTQPPAANPWGTPPTTPTPTTPTQPTPTTPTPGQPTPATPVAPTPGQPMPADASTQLATPDEPVASPVGTDDPSLRAKRAREKEYDEGAPAVTASSDVDAPDTMWSVGAEIHLDVPRGNLEEVVRTSKGLRLIGQYKVLPMLAIVSVFDFIPLLNQPSVSDDVSMNYFALHAGARLGIPNPTGWSVFGTAALGYQHVSSDLMDANGLGLLIGASAEYALPKHLTASLSLSFSNSTGNTDAEDIEVSFWTFGAGVARAF